MIRVLRRLLSMPLILSTHWKISWLRVKVEQGQRSLHAACQMESLLRVPNKQGIKNARLALEAALEKLSDADKRMQRLWG